MCKPMTKGQEHSVSSKFIHSLTHSCIHFESLLCAMHSAMPDKIKGFQTVQAAFATPSQSPDLNFAKIPYPPGSDLSKFPAPALWRTRSTFSHNPNFWEGCLGGRKGCKTELIPGGKESCVFSRGESEYLVWSHNPQILPTTHTLLDLDERANGILRRGGLTVNLHGLQLRKTLSLLFLCLQLEAAPGFL